MNLALFLLRAHYSDQDNAAIDRGIARSQHPLKLFTNQQVLFIQDDVVKVVGEGEEITYPFSP